MSPKSTATQTSEPRRSQRIADKTTPNPTPSSFFVLDDGRAIKAGLPPQKSKKKEAIRNSQVNLPQSSINQLLRQATHSNSQTTQPQISLYEAYSKTPLALSSGSHSSISSTGVSKVLFPGNATDQDVGSGLVPNQSVMEKYLQFELRGSLFCDENFIPKFLTPDLPAVRQALELYTNPYTTDPLPAVLSEKKMYSPILRQLNAILRAARPGTTSMFIDKSDTLFCSSVGDAAAAKPDLALLEVPRHHWEHVQVVVEVKSCWNTPKLKKGMYQLARYARAMFANQIHRRHVYGLLFFKWQAMFVRFDRVGVLYSKLVDISTQEFCDAFAGMMMMSREALGYDTAFTVVPAVDLEGNSEYYVDLPAEAFASPGSNRTATKTNSTNRVEGLRKLKVIKRLCQRSSVRGRATTVLVVQELESPQKPIAIRQQPKRAASSSSKPTATAVTPRKYVLKLMWRDVGRNIEGEVLQELVGQHGVAQYMWHDDAHKSCGDPGCTAFQGNPCGKCPYGKLVKDETPSREGTRVSEFLRDVEFPPKSVVAGIQEPKAPPKLYIDMELKEPSAMRHRRVYCRLLTSTLGESLTQAKSTKALLKAILDAILGYWAALNRNIMHRDISSGNVLLLPADATRPSPPAGKQNNVHPVLQASEAELRKTLTRVRKTLPDLQGESGILNDFDLYALLDKAFSLAQELEQLSFATETKIKKEKGGAAEPGSQSHPEMASKQPQEVDSKKAQKIEFRTGTPTFMSVRVMDIEAGEEYTHNFMDDLESFFWLLVWILAIHVEGQDGVSDTAQETISALDQQRFKGISDHKGKLLLACNGDGHRMKQILNSWKHSWATDRGVQQLVARLGGHFSVIWNSAPKAYKAEEQFPEVINMFLDAIKECAPESSE